MNKFVEIALGSVAGGICGAIVGTGVAIAQTAVTLTAPVSVPSLVALSCFCSCMATNKPKLAVGMGINGFVLGIPCSVLAPLNFCIIPAIPLVCTTLGAAAGGYIAGNSTSF